MKNKIPKINNEYEVCIVCEGDEEYKYFEKLKKLKVFNSIYSIKPINANGITNIISVYQDKYQSDSYSAVLIYCDTDDYPYSQYSQLKNDLKNFHGKNKFSDLPEILFFGNPCTMQIILSHFDIVKLKSRLKSRNADIIERLTGVKNYKAKDKQISSIMNKITKLNFEKMMDRIKEINVSDNKKPSSNFLNLCIVLLNNDHKWINIINSQI